MENVCDKTNENKKFEDARAFGIRKTTFIFNDTKQKVDVKREIIDEPSLNWDIARRALVDIFKRECSVKVLECHLYMYSCLINFGDIQYEYEIFGLHT